MDFSLQSCLEDARTLCLQPTNVYPLTGEQQDSDEAHARICQEGLKCCLVAS